MIYFIRYFAIILCSIFIYTKILNLPGFKLFRSLIYTAVLSAVVSLLNYHYPYTTVLVMVLISIFFFHYISHTAFEISITTTIMSYGISYIFFTLSVFLVSLIANCYHHYVSASYNQIVLQLLVAVIQIIFTCLFFSIKRFKKGMPFLFTSLTTTPLTISSVVLLFLVVMISNSKYSSFWYPLPFLFIFLLAIFIYFYWRNNITKTYLNKLKEKDIRDLNTELVKAQNRIVDLENENKELSKIIHGDNKLVPAMLFSVESFISQAGDLSPETAQTGKALLADLQQMSSTRKGILRHQEQLCISAPPTGISAIDGLFQYMQQKAYDMEIKLEITVSCDLKDFVTNQINEMELRTLLADLLENALIATQYRKGNYVLLAIDKVNKHYSINIFDRGIPFTKEVLADLGLSRHTTHADNGGSGIGLVTTYDLLQKYRASLLIEEYESDSGLFTKKLSVTFNKLGQYTLATYRDMEEINYIKKRRNVFMIQKKREK